LESILVVRDKRNEDMKISSAERARNRHALLDAAMRLFRERGFSDVTIADIAAEAGLTHGAFYTHFASKEALCAEALEEAMAQRRERAQKLDRVAHVTGYLSERHVRNRGEGCPIAALSGDVGRESPTVRVAFTKALSATIEAAAGRSSERGEAARRGAIATLVGALVLARGVSDQKLRDEILAAARTSLLDPAA
jgi:TetR/AcrR family transcriptional repressor of nem operon